MLIRACYSRHFQQSSRMGSVWWWMAKLYWARKWKAGASSKHSCVHIATKHIHFHSNGRREANASEWRNLFKYAYHIRIDTKIKAANEWGRERGERKSKAERPISAIINAFCFRCCSGVFVHYDYFMRSSFIPTFVIQFSPSHLEVVASHVRVNVFAAVDSALRLPFIFQMSFLFSPRIHSFRMEN